MSSNRWLTKQDVLNDLTMITGRRATNIDDRFAVRGARPPPVNLPDKDEDEFIQTYGQYASRDSSIAKPDLSGITHMLRMINDYYDSATYDDNENIKELKKTANAVIGISKLNPNVPEFIPKNVGNAAIETKNVVENGHFSKLESDGMGISKSNSKSLDIKHLVCKYDDGINKTDAIHKNETNNNDIDVTKKIDIFSLNSNDIKDMREKLKLKIGSISEVECLKKKRERNLAMASLLKLYTDIPKCPKNDPPLKLMTPECFQILPEDIRNNSIETETKQNVIKEDIKTETISISTATLSDKNVKHILRPTDPINESSFSPKTISQESIEVSSNKISDTNLHNNIITKEVEESVKKVDKWLDGPEKKKHKSRAIFFGPVTFKRKETSSVKYSETSSLPIIDNIERPSTAQTSDSFVPSEYANKLTKSYMERSRSNVAQCFS